MSAGTHFYADELTRWKRSHRHQKNQNAALRRIITALLDSGAQYHERSTGELITIWNVVGDELQRRMAEQAEADGSA